MAYNFIAHPKIREIFLESDEKKKMDKILKSLERKDSFIRFRELPQTGKTKRFLVQAVKHQNILGHVQWYGAWRRYCFFPAANTIFEPNCMFDIIGLMDSLMEDRRLEKKK